MVWFLLIVCAASAAAEETLVTPDVVPQGSALQIRSDGSISSARLNGRTIPLFSQTDGGRLGLMPVEARTRPGLYKLDLLGDDGAVVASRSVTVSDAKFPTQNVRLSGAVSRLKPSPGEMETVRALRNTASDKRHWDEPFVRPVPGCQTSPFGVMRLHNGKPTGSYHGGVDQRGAKGTPVRATASGIVKISRMFNIHGGTIGIDHGQAVTSHYLHLSRLAAKEGDVVNKGDVIGYVGSTGRSTAPHLHWGLTVNTVSVNPAQWVELKPCPKPAPRKPKARRKR